MKPTDFQDYLTEQLKDPKFKKEFKKVKDPEMFCPFCKSKIKTGLKFNAVEKIYKRIIKEINNL